MTDYETKRSEFEQRLDAIVARRKGAAGQAAGELPEAGDFERRLDAWEARLERRLAEFRGEAPARPGAAESAPPPAPETPRPRRRRPFAGPDQSIATWLDDLERMMLEELELGRRELPPGFRRPAQVAADDRAMRAAAAGACPPGTSLPNDLDLGVLHVPGQGTLVNRQHYARRHGPEPLEAGDPQVGVHLASEAARQRWGWGFLLEYTAVGQAAGAAGLWPALTAARLGLPCPASPAAALAAALRQAWILSEAGWLDWTWQYAMFKARHPLGAGLLHRPRPGRTMELLVKALNVFPLYITSLGIHMGLRGLADLFKFLFLEESELVPAALNNALLAAQQFCTEHDAGAARLVGLPFSLLLGRLYFARLEANVGILGAPYAALIAGHVPNLDLSPGSSPARLLEQVQAEPRLNPDTRLALLSSLDPAVKYDPKEVFTAAWERLRLDGPRQYFD